MQIFKISPMRWFAILFVSVLLLSLILSPDPRALATFHISRETYRVIIAFLLLPEAIIWYATFFALAKLQEYTRYLKHSKEGKAFSKITTGMGILAFGLIISSIVSLILGEITAQHSGFRSAAAIIDHYIAMLVPVFAFTYINSGTHLLMLSVKKIGGLWRIRVFIIIFFIIGVFFTRTALRTRILGTNPYYLGAYPLMLTIIIPYLYAWFEGLSSAYNLQIYSFNVKGVLYRKALQQLAAGLAVTIAGFIGVQFITSTVGAKTNESLGFVLIIIYMLLAVLLGGLGYIALGTKKLKRIEEV